MQLLHESGGGRRCTLTVCEERRTPLMKLLKTAAVPKAADISQLDANAALPWHRVSKNVGKIARLTCVRAQLEV